MKKFLKAIIIFAITCVITYFVLLLYEKCFGKKFVDFNDLGSLFHSKRKMIITGVYFVAVIFLQVLIWHLFKTLVIVSIVLCIAAGVYFGYEKFIKKDASSEPISYILE